MFRAKYPSYSENLGLVAGKVVENQPGSLIVDIGGNVGDSAAIIRAYTDAKIIAVEGNRKFLGYLRANADMIGNVEIYETYLGQYSGSEQFEQLMGHGTNRLSFSNSAMRQRLSTLDELMSPIGELTTIGLIKVDTDGMDIEILMGGLNTISHHHPVLFFEYDPRIAKPGSIDLAKLCSELCKRGNTAIHAYDNYGHLLLSLKIDDDQLIFELQSYLSAHHSPIYLDLVIFHESNQVVMDRVRFEEENKRAVQNGR